jgi:hypothetical protein
VCERLCPLSCDLPSKCFANCNPPPPRLVGRREVCGLPNRRDGRRASVSVSGIKTVNPQISDRGLLLSCLLNPPFPVLLHLTLITVFPRQASLLLLVRLLQVSSFTSFPPPGITFFLQVSKLCPTNFLRSRLSLFSAHNPTTLIRLLEEPRSEILPSPELGKHIKTSHRLAPQELPSYHGLSGQVGITI